MAKDEINQGIHGKAGVDEKPRAKSTKAYTGKLAGSREVADPQKI